MSDLRLHHPVKPSALVRQGGGPGHIRTLQNANKEALHLLGQPIDTPGDPKGRVLRMLRLQIGIDPSLLATQACMSLSQLYELEEGGNSRFYSDSLRRQAGRRVARLLGADWDRIEQVDHSKAQTTSNVVPLQRPGSGPVAPAIVEVKVRVATEPTQSITMSADEYHQSSPVNPEQAVSMGLSTPASETLLIEPPSVPQFVTAPAPVRKSPAWGVASILFLVLLLVAAGTYAFVEYSPYRLYWPW